MEKSLSQGDQIRAVCQRLGLTPSELADRVPMKHETMRKVVNGYQRASERTMQSIANIERTMNAPNDDPASHRGASVSPYGIMKRATLERNFIEVAEQLPGAPPHERRHILLNLRAMLDELEHREACASAPARRGPLTEAQAIALQASEKIDRSQTRMGGSPSTNVPLSGPAEPLPPPSEPAD